MGESIDEDACPHREPAYCAGGGAAERRIRAEAAAAWMLECVTVRPVRDDFATSISGCRRSTSPVSKHGAGTAAR